jgi:hypothetical protein
MVIRGADRDGGAGEGDETSGNNMGGGELQDAAGAVARTFKLSETQERIGFRSTMRIAYEDVVEVKVLGKGTRPPL